MEKAAVNATSPDYGENAPATTKTMKRVASVSMIWKAFATATCATLVFIAVREISQNRSEDKTSGMKTIVGEVNSSGIFDGGVFTSMQHAHRNINTPRCLHAK